MSIAIYPQHVATCFLYADDILLIAPSVSGLEISLSACEEEQYAVDSCPLLVRQTLSFEFTPTRIFIKLFRTGSSKVVNECQVSFDFLPAKSQILIRTDSFLQKFIVSENSLCMLFANDARESSLVHVL